MSGQLKIWKIILLLLLGLLVFLFIAATSVLEIRRVHSTPAGGFDCSFDNRAGYVFRVLEKGPAGKAGLRIGDSILAVNGNAVATEKNFWEVYEKLKVGDEVQLSIARSGERFLISFPAERRIIVYAHEILLNLVPAIVFCDALWLIGIFVFLKRIQDRTAHVFYLMLLFWALAMWIAIRGSALLHLGLPKWIHYPMELPAWPLAVGLMLHFFLIFPIRSKIIERYPRLTLGLAYAPLLLIPIFLYAEAQGFPWHHRILKVGWGVWLTLYFILGLLALSHSARHASTPHMRRQAQIMVRGTCLSLGVPMALAFLPKLIFEIRIPYAEIFTLLIVSWPIILAYAIVKHRFMNVDVIVKRGLAYAFTSGFVIAAYFLFVVGLGQLLLSVTGFTNQILTIIATLLIATAFDPVKNRVRNFVDRKFYPNRLVYREAVRDFSHSLVNVVDLHKLLDLVQAFLSETMQIRPVIILWHEESGTRYAVRLGASASPVAEVEFTDSDKAVQRMANRKQLVDLSPCKERPEYMTEDEKQRWGQLGAEIVLPLLSQQRLVGMISLGTKGDDEAYYKEDLDLLQTLCDQMNISMENAFLTEELREQDRLKKELEVARRIQLSSLPQSDPKIPGLDISGISIPALEVGGDYYDYLEFPDGRFGVVVGDVSGKGTSAALYMSQLKGILHTAAKYHRSLRDLLVEVNAITYRNMEVQSYITLMCGAFDLKSRQLNLARAGHLPLLHYSTRDGACRQIVPRGIGIGLETGPIFENELEEIQIQICKGDVFLFYTDGIQDARDEAGHEFETERLFEILRSNGKVNAYELRDAIIKAVDDFAVKTSPRDDMTVVVVKVT